MLNYQTAYEVWRLEQDLREHECARAAAARYSEQRSELHDARPGSHGRRGRLVAVAGLVGAAALLLAQAQLPATTHAQEPAPAIVKPVDC
jgi:hypothetical protein